MTRKVIDSNYFNSEELNLYLASSSHNYAVVTDYAAIEGYKSSNPLGIYESLKILKKYPNQVITLKGTSTCCGIIDAGSIADELIDWNQTNSFSDFCGHLERAKNGDHDIIRFIEENRKAAILQLSRMQNDLDKMNDGIKSTGQTYTQNQILKVRRGDFDADIFHKAIRDALIFAWLMFSEHPNVLYMPSEKQLKNTFILRQAICVQAMVLMWLKGGSQNDLSFKNLLNSQIDINFATFGMFYDGLLTNDRKLIEIYELAVRLFTYFETRVLR